jgi:hypothetical protein
MPLHGLVLLLWNVRITAELCGELLMLKEWKARVKMIRPGGNH